jgi:hypothetical protein
MRKVSKISYRNQKEDWEVTGGAWGKMLSLGIINFSNKNRPAASAA